MAPQAIYHAMERYCYTSCHWCVVTFNVEIDSGLFVQDTKYAYTEPGY
jgi:hypothetical protein